MGARSAGSPLTVLVAEDDADTRALLSMLLEDEGYRVLAAPNGEVALALALDRRVDVVLMDLSMPRLGGEAFCRAYRERGGEAPVVVITAARGDELLAAIEACGAADYVVKPFDVDTLLATIERHAGRPA